MAKISSVAVGCILLVARSSAFVPVHHSTSHHTTTPVDSICSSSNGSTSLLYARKTNNDMDNVENDFGKNFLESIKKTAAVSALALGLTFTALGSNPLPALATDSGAIVGCLFSKCQVPLLKCIANPKCLANVVCINTCNGRDDEIECQIKCGDLFENSVVGEFNKCALSDMACVPRKEDEGFYPVPAPEALVPKFDTKLWNGKWYITSGQNELFDIFPCQVHFFTETAPGKFYGKLNWRIEEPDGEFFTRDAVQEFVQDPEQPGHLINHDNEYLHYKDDWYILDYEYDDNEAGLPPFALVYYRGSNDAWDGYGGAVVYTRDSKLPDSLLPRLRESAKKVGFDYDKDFTATDNSCKAVDQGENILLREQFAGKVLLNTEKSVQAQATKFRGNAMNSIKAQKIFFSNEGKVAQEAFEKLSQEVQKFEAETVAGVSK
uniref:VDE lipocalin domain-containing protein n=1 Tax=Pseudo-nitzschia australis TaxID=44445 RepID=A0A7S4AXJ6_9STRA|mmetsp:Transcript_17210/g.37655  ORF Transcript_17210/g.37655 Transcript_17210/m.37655 type:complete len:435 (-) Transcript_17210:260-1564(-)|eukprot:CAMPEP_0168193730 /NCGR_PEP_ID=MMETSP0139_2-20121125/18771_1 /TAXON_ID=44445 /ORGANISM="Pseudo-nitzschia australis, Strain 10249 10 AB" /LENGTH=434 /DNA_ID=CAMNT_0008117123 /DNA_START=186 /DNA_END=1490 /DNA_ORIENTATION=-